MENKIIIQFDYKTLKNTQYVGEFGEQLIRLNFTINNIDTFIPLIDDKAIDFIARTENSKYFDIQVKTIRWTKERYFYEVKEKWGELIRPNLLIAFVILISEKEPILILIPGENWVEESRNNKIFANRDYEGKKSKAEWGLTINEKNISYLREKYEINKILKTL
jgi:hypothetical protein